MKKLAAVFFIIFMITGSFLVSAKAEETIVKAENLNNGVYSIDVESSSSMFRIIDCQLNVHDGDMTAVMTLSGKGYEKLYMGTGEEAEKSSEESYIYYVENSDGKYTYTVPVEALDMGVDCAAWSIRKKKWYDRTIVFNSAALPENAYKSEINLTGVIVPSAAVIAFAGGCVIAMIIKSKRKEVKQDED